MIIILILFIIGIAITYASWKSSTENGGIACSIIITIVIAVTWACSYDTYLETRSFYSATKEQYHSAIDVYKDHAVIDMGKAAFTDLKYHGYQENVGSFVNDLRNKIIEYNTTIVKKQVMGKNPIFSWFIIEPDKDMVIIKMKSE